MSIFHINGKKQKGLLLTGLIALFCFFIIGPVNADVPLIEDFDSYSTGLLGGNGGWSSNSRMYITTAQSETSPNSIHASTGYTGTAYTSGETVTDGSWAFSFYLSSDYSGEFLLNFQGLASTNDNVFSAKFEDDPVYGNIFHVVAVSDETLATNLSLDAWHTFKIIFDCNENTYSASIDELTPVDSSLNAFPTLQRINLAMYNSYLYLDSIEEGGPMCAIGSCGICESYYPCIEAGCFWYYSSYLQGSYCIEPYEPEPEECGPMWKCQFCGSQALCEAESDCEWADRGFGDACYMIEPTLPLTEGDWEEPDIDTCDGLSGTDLWLCEIKNFLAGLFMPSQEKLSELNTTFGAFKQKFPFNYVNQLGTFLDNIKEGIYEDNDIPITILGHESTVSFDFFESESEVGGETESFGDTIKSFTAIVIIFAFLMWILNFIDRFKAL
jgi:hypothetical protein